MDFSINTKRLSSPKNIMVSCPKGPQILVITWDDIQNLDILNIMYNIYYSIMKELKPIPLCIDRYPVSSVGRAPAF